MQLRAVQHPWGVFAWIIQIMTVRSAHLSPVSRHLDSSVFCRYFPHTFEWHLLNRSCCYLHWDNTVREVTMPWDLPVNFRNIKGPETHLWFSSHDRKQSCGEEGGWDSIRPKKKKRSEVCFDLHEKEMKTYYCPSDFIFEWCFLLIHLYMITFKISEVKNWTHTLAAVMFIGVTVWYDV